MLTKNQNKIIGGIMKKLVIAVLIGAMLLSFAACGKTSKDNTQANATGQQPTTGKNVATSTTTEKPTETGNADIMSPLELKDCTVQITEIKIIPSTMSDEEGKYVLKLVYNITNKKEEGTMPTFLFSSKAFQNGIEIDSTFYNEKINVDKNLKKIKHGVTIKGCEKGFDLEDMSEVELEIDDIINFDSKPKYTFKIDLNNIEIEE